jgi:peptidoglycan/LPS O-acetylase OafA/YrhL
LNSISKTKSLSNALIQSNTNLRLFSLPGNDYNPTVDYLRLIAAIEIVLFHAHAPLGQFGTAAVGVFVVLMVFFSLRGSQRGRMTSYEFILYRGPRLLRPYLLWSMVYIVMISAKAVIQHEPIVGALGIWLPPNGSQGQLWFLPWALIVCVALNYFASFSWSGETESRHVALLVAATVLLCPICLMVWTYTDLPQFLALSILYVPSVMVAALVFVFQKSAVHLTLVAIGSILGAWGMQTAGLNGTMQLSIGVPISIFAMCFRTPALSWSKQLNQLSMDVYLVHVAVLSAVVQLTPFSLWTVEGGALVVIISILVSLPLQIPRIARLTH